MDIIKHLVDAQFQEPSLHSFIAILVWKLYIQTQCALVNQELDSYLRSKSSKDWFTIQHSPSEEECFECRQIVLNNLLLHELIEMMLQLVPKN
ncbi:hypothetical protein L208DRAFT_419764 [Tricholoma matsutake]|nr:hypothetical protein L208DRAFT_419764 [Tricholoma matsutake 945]